MTEIYITDEIIIKDNKLYHNDIIIKNHNWHNKLKDIGWTKLHKKMIHTLNIYNDNKYKSNSLFGSLECGDDGDCLFHCISHALNSSYESIYDASDIREIVANSVTLEQFNEIISIYRSMKDVNDFNESWNPYDISDIDSFRNEIKKEGHSYWGDFILLELLMKALSINILIFIHDDLNNIYDKYNLPYEYDPSKKTIILLYENNLHFKLIGHFNNTMVTLFTYKTLPIEVKRYYNV